MIVEYLKSGDPKVCEVVLRALPNWFGIEESTLEYINKSKELPMVVAREGETVLGFLSLLAHSPYTAEVYVMGVIPTQHRQGVGKALMNKAESILRQEGTEFLQVKTVSEGRVCEFYEKTRNFYRGYGFRDVEVFPTLWHEANPCLLLIKTI